MENLLSLLNDYTLNNADDVTKAMAEDFRKRRIEKNLTREQVAEISEVTLGNIVRVEQKGKILIYLAMDKDYTLKGKSIFAEPKYSTMEELTQISRNKGKTRAHESQKI